MHRNIALIVVMAAAGAWAQSTPSAPGTPAAKPATGTKPAVHATPSKPIAVINTTVGKLTCILFPDKAPIGVENFIGLASGTKDWKNPVSGATKHGVPLYDGTIFHRVIPEFMIQGGDPAGNGSGDPGYKFKNEVSSDLLFDQPGRLAYANAGPDTNGSQFFITEDAEHSRQLSGSYTIFGQCDEASVALVKQIARMSRDPSNYKPFRPVKILHISIVRSTGTAPKPGAGTTVKKPAAATPKAPPKPS